MHRLQTDIGFNNTVLQRFSSYLTECTQCVSLSNHCSAFAPVHSGVPQSSVLGPILFSVYVNLCLSLLNHTLSYTIHLLMTYNYRCLLHMTKYQSLFTQCNHAYVMSRLGRLRTCLKIIKSDFILQSIVQIDAIFPLFF